MILVIEAIVLWKQGQFPVITVDRQSDVQIAQSDSVNKSVTIQTDGLAAEESETEWEEAGQQTVLEQVFGVRLRVEEGVIEFYRKEEKIDVIPGEK